MSKEWLEELIAHFNYCIENGLTIGEQEEKLLHELYEQAERVQELEDKLARIRFVNSDYDKINKRYREAIKKIKFLPDYVHSSTQHVEYINSIIVELEESE